MPEPQFSLQEKRNFARTMRRNMTRAENALWYKISRNHFGYRFQRQFLLRGYIVDFYCAQLRTIVEIDGSIHDIEDVAADDEQRERILESYGFLVLRFSNEDVLNHMSVVLTRLWDECAARRAALKAFSSKQFLSAKEKQPAALNSSCESVEKPARAATVDKTSEDGTTATPEDFQRIKEAWQKLVVCSRERGRAFDAADNRTVAEKAFNQKYALQQHLQQKRPEIWARVIAAQQARDREAAGQFVLPIFGDGSAKKLAQSESAALVFKGIDLEKQA